MLPVMNSRNAPCHDVTMQESFFLSLLERGTLPCSAVAEHLKGTHLVTSLWC